MAASQAEREAGGAPAVLAILRARGGLLPPGYACETPASHDAAELLTLLGLPGDTTYTGRTVAALLQRAPLERGTHLYWHTLGSEGPG